jgi:hypothetical protein
VSSYSSPGVRELGEPLLPRSPAITPNDRVDDLRPTLVERSERRTRWQRLIGRVILGTTFHHVPFCSANDSHVTKVPEPGTDWKELRRSQNLFNFNDFDVRLARPLGRLGASRPPAAGEGIPVNATSRGNLRNSSLRSQDTSLNQTLGVGHFGDSEHIGPVVCDRSLKLPLFVESVLYSVVTNF